MFCPQCGMKCPDDSRFCEHCGSPIAPLPPPAQSAPPVSPERDPLADTVSAIEESVRRTQAVSPPPPVTSWTPPMPVRKKSYTGLIVALAAVLVVLGAAGGGVFYLFHLRSANEAKLSENLMDLMWTYCEADILDYYDDALSKPYSERGYKVERKASAFSLGPGEKDVFPVSGRIDIIDRVQDGDSYRVEIEGAVKTNFMRSEYTWDLEYDFEEPPLREPEDAPEDTPEDPAAGPEDAGSQEPSPDTAPDNPVSAGGSSSAVSADAYLWPTDSQYITDADLDGFERKQIMLMRNELYARYGCSFQDEEIRTYFESQSWYEPNPDLLAVDFKREWFNDYETANLDTILNYERAKGWRK